MHATNMEFMWVLGIEAGILVWQIFYLLSLLPAFLLFLFHLFVFVKALPSSLNMTSPEDKALQSKVKQGCHVEDHSYTCNFYEIRRHYVA